MCSGLWLAGMLYTCMSFQGELCEKLRSLVRKRGFSGGQVEGLVCSQAGVRLFLRSGGVFTLFASNPSTGNVSSP